MANKHFIVTNKAGTKRLIQAKNKGEALSFVIGSEYTCEIAKTSDVVEMFTNGVQMEIANPGAQMEIASQDGQESSNADDHTNNATEKESATE